MSNMGYVRFENTLDALTDVHEHMDDELSREEDAARADLVKLCQEIATDYGEEPDSGGPAKFTVVGLWHEGRPVVAGVLGGPQSAHDDGEGDDAFEGRWLQNVSAASPAQAEEVAILAMMRLRYPADYCTACGARLADAEVDAEETECPACRPAAAVSQ